MKRFLMIVAVLFFVAASAMRLSGADDESNTETPPGGDVCGNVCFPRAQGGLFICHVECKAVQTVHFPTGIDFIVKKVRENLPPPIFKSAELSPDPLQAGGPVEIKLTPQTEDFEVFKDYEVKYLYAFDAPSDWKSLRPILDPAGGFWKTSIDIPQNASELYAAARAGDADGNTYIEIPCRVSSGSAKSDDCFFPLWEDDSYADVKDFDINPSLDLLDAKFGMDDKYFHFRIKVRGPIDPGQLNPTSINYYMIGIYDPGRPVGVDPYHRTTFILYSPYLYRVFKHDPAQKQLFDDATACEAVLNRAGEWTADSGAVKCSVEGDTLVMSIRRGTLGQFVTGVFVAYAATGIVFDEFSGIVADYTPTAAVRIDKTTIDIQK
jgi:hypothetical protein